MTIKREDVIAGLEIVSGGYPLVPKGEYILSFDELQSFGNHFYALCTGE